MGNLIRQAYEAGGRYQWAREAWRNSEESGASVIEFGIEEQAARTQGVLRRTIMDNGSGMAPDDLLVFLSSFGGGGKPIGVDGNFGQGFKSSVLPWNPYGVVVISYTEEEPDGYMVWIHREGDSYTFREWDVYDEEDETYLGRQDVIPPYLDEEHGCDWRRVRPDWMKTGTVMVLLGASAASDTWKGDPDPARSESVDGLVRYLNGRLMDVPERDGSRVRTTVVDLYRKGRSERRDNKDRTVELPDGSSMVWRPRRVYGMRHYIPSTPLRGEVVVDEHGTVAEWFYVAEPDAPVGGGVDYIDQHPVVVVDYQGEAYHADHTKSRYRQFGITDEIKGRTWLIVRPPVFSDSRPTEWGVLTQASRHILMAKGGAELPWDEWGDAFFEAFPEPLKKALDSARASSGSRADGTMGKNLTRILDRLNPRFKASRTTASSGGRVPGILAGAAVAGTRSRNSADAKEKPALGRRSGPESRILVPTRGGGAQGAAARMRGGYPAFRWETFDAKEAKFLARYAQNETMDVEGFEHRGVVHLNSAHPVFQQEFNHWTRNVWPKATSDNVQQLVQRVYGEEAVAHVVHAQSLNGTLVARTEDGEAVAIGREDVSELLTPQALSAALLGLINVEQRILTQGGGLFGSRSNA
ncbi:hypothetical protein [Streptomyces sp. SP18CS02]|uniref:hypothetical protein n=1 Tax=Streptomyces sp. SP18CS02 TaxID=3002531 RepID=UPI002E76C4E4|nr:hypothetical protein [Streptomyces sp. SP18CS02]MEE1752325.1 hypothetical protein [Streptomyces sp. SP18CS02]